MLRSWRAILLIPIRALPADLAVTIGVSLLTIGAVFVPGVQDTPLRRILALPFLLFFPGYALTSLLFPKKGSSPAAYHEGGRGHGSDDGIGGALSEGARVAVEPVRERGIDWIERLAMSFGLSIAVVPLLGLAIFVAPVDFTLAVVLVTVTGFTGACAIGAAYRRWTFPPEERFRVSYREWMSQARFNRNRLDAALNVVLVLSIVLTVAVLVGAALFPPDGERYTEFYLLTENNDSNLTAAGYPEELAVGDAAELVAVVENRERTPVTYTVVVQLQRVDSAAADNDTRVVAVETLGRFQKRLEHGEVWQQPHEITPTMTGDALRLQYLLYQGEPPSNVNARTAYRELHIWLNVTEVGGDTGS